MSREGDVPAAPRRKRNRGRPALAERVEPCSVAPRESVLCLLTTGVGQLPFTRLVWGKQEEQEPDGSERSGEGKQRVQGRGL